MKNSKSEKSEISFSEKLEKVEKIRKTCVRKIEDIIGEDQWFSVKIFIYKSDELYDAAGQLGWESDGLSNTSWIESPTEIGYTVLFHTDE